MTYEEHFADLVKRGCNDRDAAIIAQSRADYDAAKNAPPAPRPTCGTCPHWKPDASESDTGECKLFPVTMVIWRVEHDERGYAGEPAPEPIYRSDYCGQHPDMAAWIEKEWPKVRAGR